MNRIYETWFCIRLGFYYMPSKVRSKVGSWDLGDLEKSYNEGYEKFLQAIEEKVKKVESKQRLLSDTISSGDFKSVLFEIEGISENMSIATGYSHLLYASDTSSNEGAALMTKMDGLSSKLSNRLLFFDTWFKNTQKIAFKIHTDRARRENYQYSGGNRDQCINQNL